MCGEHCCQTWVYPRVCGGTAALAFLQREREGLSPRVRGNQYHPAPLPAQHHGSIPACAGEPKDSSCYWTPTPGLSPRVRGNLVGRLGGDAAVRDAAGSIPACAGEPYTWQPDSHRGTRSIPACAGEPAVWEDRLMLSIGLSPRVRGNLVCRRRFAIGSGSIPACAGEPTGPRQRTHRPGVYPRVCGGTTSSCSSRYFVIGSIPACAGEPSVAHACRCGPRSIPACAGEPRAA